MEISPIKIFYMAMSAVAFGAFMGAFNDLNRIVRALLGQNYGKHNFEFLYDVRLPISKRRVGAPKARQKMRGAYAVLIFFQDLVLFAVAGAGVAILNYYFNNGRARLYTPAAVILGFICYYFTVGRATLYLSDVFVFILRFVFFTIFGIFYYPARYFVNFFGFFVKNIYKNLNKTIAKRQKRVYNNSKEKNVMVNAAYGFVDVAKSDPGGSDDNK